MKIVRTCSCGNTESIDLTPEEYEQYQKWRRGELHIQDIKTLNACEREFLKTGLCRACQEDIFLNGKSDRIKSAKEKVRQYPFNYDGEDDYELLGGEE